VQEMDVRVPDSVMIIGRPLNLSVFHQGWLFFISLVLKIHGGEICAGKF
jgi:hypothetical protein